MKFRACLFVVFVWWLAMFGLPAMEREEAITIAHEYGLEEEVIYEMDMNGCTPEEALYKWDLL